MPLAIGAIPIIGVTNELSNPAGSDTTWFDLEDTTGRVMPSQYGDSLVYVYTNGSSNAISWKLWLPTMAQYQQYSVPVFLRFKTNMDVVLKNSDVFFGHIYK
jgi:hypothetical protein